MSRYYYDLHVHSCLSPCGDDDNTPNNLAGVGTLAGLQIMALTDHNTCKNCPAFMAAAKKQGIIPIPGMELTTAEDIHMVCLFPTLEAALAFDKEIETRLVKIDNRPDIFGEQWVMDENDEVIGKEQYLLSNATTVTLEESVPLVEHFGGICYPAHIDRDANGILAILGAIPAEMGFTCVELHDAEKAAALRPLMPIGCQVVISSDAHFLWDVRDAANSIEIEDEPYSGQLVRERLLQMLGGKR